MIDTESFLNDAVIPDNTVLAAGGFYLIADAGWDDSKDDDSWRSADFEERITLGNSDSGVALVANGSVVDAVGWGDVEGIEDNLFEGTPAALVSPGRALLRTQDTDDNSEDFVEAVADFQDGIPVSLSAEVIVSVPVIEVSDSLNLDPEGVLSIRNNGDSAVSVKILFNDLRFKDNVIPKTALSLDGPSEFVVQPNSEHESMVSLRIPSNVVPGKYTSTLRVLISGS
ncbi:hypothetical protein KY309_01585 [Candidatus Woesearchaeota archaeon]|nr:hypothetical protein [Candidatus Woesearchaeota archaeon]